MLLDQRPENAIPGSQPTQWFRVVVWVWILIVAGICLRSLLTHANTTYQYYRVGGSDWLHSHELYQVLGGTCRYSPLIHALLVPLPLLPDRLGELGWRLVNLSVYLAGLLCWMRLLLPRLSDKHAGLVLLLALPLSVGSLNNAQANPLMTGLILLGLAAAAGERWNRAAICLVLATLFKLYPLAIVLLLIVLYPRRFGGRFVVALAAGLLVPFVLQSPDYVARQYGNWWHNLVTDDRAHNSLSHAYRDLWQLIRLAGIPLTRASYPAVQLAAAVGVAILCWLRQRRQGGAPELLNTALALGTCWMILCGPATESSTYILLAPTLAWTVVDAWRQPRSRFVQELAAGSLALFGLAMVANWFPFAAAVHARGPHPLAALLLTAANVWVCVTSRPGSTPAREAPPRSDPAWAA
jgi:hypothetical protein